MTFSLSSARGAFELTVDNRMLHAPIDTGYGLVGHARARRRARWHLPRRSRRRDVADPRRDPDARARAVSVTPGEPPITVLLADDQAMVRAGFRMIVDSQPDMTVIGEADNGRAAVELARADPTGRLPARHPDARARRAGRDPPPRRPRRAAAAARRHRDDVRLRRARPDRPAQRRRRLHPQGQRPAPAPRGGARRRSRRRPDLPVDHGALPRPLRQAHDDAAATAITRSPNESSTSPAPSPAASATRRSPPSCSSRCPR